MAKMDAKMGKGQKGNGPWMGRNGFGEADFEDYDLGQ
jgi:hypothetical protein